jgi:hypothetical protein
MEQPKGKLLIYNGTDTAKTLSVGGTGLIPLSPEELTPEGHAIWEDCRRYYRHHRRGKAPYQIGWGDDRNRKNPKGTTKPAVVLDRIAFYLSIAHLWEPDFGILEGCMTLRDLLRDVQVDIRHMRKKVRAKASKVPAQRLAGLTDVARKLTIDLIREGERMRDRKEEYLEALRKKAEQEQPIPAEDERALAAAIERKKAEDEAAA